MALPTLPVPMIAIRIPIFSLLSSRMQEICASHERNENE